MALLSDRDLDHLRKSGKLIIEPFSEKINATSIDLRLGALIIVYRGPVVELGKVPNYKEMDIQEGGYLLMPGDFILGMTKERVAIPNGYHGLIETKGNIARAGIQMHNCDGHIDPGFDGHITLEISNRNTVPVRIFPDLYVCQLFLFQLSSESIVPYKGRYAGHAKPTVYLPDGVKKPCDVLVKA
jgi:dCTP deaminase